jgi:acetyl esterase/lipase
MKIEKLHPDLHKAYGRIPAIPFHNPALYFLLNLWQKLQPKKIKPFPGVAVEDRPLTRGGVRIYRPERGGHRAGLLWIHGGGYIIGNAGTNDRECVAIVRELGLLVVSVDYRLAPRHPFPAALDDCFEAWNYMQSHAEQWSIDRDRIALLGQSAGGGLAACLAQRIADAGGVQPAAQVLTYPMLDDRTVLNATLESIKHRLWNNKNNRGAWTWYLGQPAGQASAPRYAVAARRENLSGLPPAWVGVGEHDLFYEEDRAYAERLKAAGVLCEFYVGPQCPHGYDLIAPEAPVSQALIQAYYRYLRVCLRLN